MKSVCKYALYTLLACLAALILSTCISYYLPGRFKLADRSSIALEKGFVSWIDGRAKTRKEEERNALTALSFDRLKPYLDSLQPGSLFFSDNGTSTSSFLIPDTWKHCGVYLGTKLQTEAFWKERPELLRSLEPFYDKGEEYLVLDATYKKGVAIHDIRNMAGLSGRSTLQEIQLVEPLMDTLQRARVLKLGMEHVGKPYDHLFHFGNDEAHYCSELIYYLFPAQQERIILSHSLLGKKLLLPSDLLSLPSFQVKTIVPSPPRAQSSISD